MNITNELRCAFDGTVGDYCMNDSFRYELQEVIDGFADRIDAEVADKYVKLPTDLDGSVWHVGDEIDSGGIVRELRYFGGFAFYPWLIWDGKKELMVRHRHANCHAKSPFERIRDLAKAIPDSESKTIAKRYADELMKIADELEGEGEEQWNQ